MLYFFTLKLLGYFKLLFFYCIFILIVLCIILNIFFYKYKSRTEYFQKAKTNGSYIEKKILDNNIPYYFYKIEESFPTYKHIKRIFYLHITGPTDWEFFLINIWMLHYFFPYFPIIGKYFIYYSSFLYLSMMISCWLLIIRNVSEIYKTAVVLSYYYPNGIVRLRILRVVIYILTIRISYLVFLMVSFATGSYFFKSYITTEDIFPIKRVDLFEEIMKAIFNKETEN